MESKMKELTTIAFASAGKDGMLSRCFELCDRRDRPVKMYKLFPYSA